MVTIDGPAGVGKSTVGRQVAQHLNLAFVDTGLFYRGLTVLAGRSGLGTDRPDPLAKLARQLHIEINPDPAAAAGAWQVRVSGEELGDELWDPSQATLLAYVASQPEVRRALLQAQRRPARQGAVAVGRDTGTVVFPGATCKVYLEAPVAVRLQRRRGELARRGLDDSEAALEADVIARDHTDSSRADAPLARAPDALAIDTSRLSAAEVVVTVLAACHRRGLRPRPAVLRG
ncbi:MAG: (d)CMP kinase [Candidatus Dormibacteria bacterium]